MSLQKSEAGTIRILLVDDRSDVRDGIAALVESAGNIAVVAQARDGIEAVELFHSTLPDVVLMDLQMPRMGGVEATAKILGAFPEARVIVLTSFGSEAEIKRALDAGARCHLYKEDSAKLVDIIHQVHAGRIRVSASGA